jgi:hypothetical protein
VGIFTYEIGPDEDYLYHYTGSTTLALILDSGSLRLGPYANTNDPRENREWLASMGVNAEFEDIHGEVDYFSLARQLDAALRQRARLVCMTQDRPRESHMSTFHRGWARARMWSQYAEGHRGACLVFNRDCLDAAIRGAVGGATLLCRAVQYTDDFDSARGLHVSAEEILESGAQEVAKRIIAAQGEELFFEKNPDWATESEYRYVAVGESVPEFVDVRSCLSGIVLGMDFPTHELSVIKVRLERLGLADLPLARAVWMNGSPLPVPALPSESAV